MDTHGGYMRFASIILCGYDGFLDHGFLNVGRVNRLAPTKIHAELDYLHIGFNKTAGHREREAWGWVTQAIEQKLREIQNV
jgi:hypothetical protein